MTLLALILVTYVFRRPLVWLGIRLIAFTAEFVVGREVMKSRR